MKHRPFRGVVCVDARDRDELPQNAAFMKPVQKVENKEMAQYIIWNPSSTKPPTVRFSTRPEAIRVSGRMAHENPGETFFVAKLVNSACKPVPVEVSYQDLDK